MTFSRPFSLDRAIWWIAAALVLLALAGRGQPFPQPVTVTNYYAVCATDGYGYSPYSNEVAVTNQPSGFDWSPSLTPGVLGYWLAWGRQSGVYTHSNYVGMVSMWFFPVPPPVVISAYLGGVRFYCVTNPAGSLFFKASATSASNLYTVSDSTDLANWTNPFAIIQTTNPNLNITKQ